MVDIARQAGILDMFSLVEKRKANLVRLSIVSFFQPICDWP